MGKLYSTVPTRRLRGLAKALKENGRDYSKPSLGEILSEARESCGKKKPQKWMKIVSVPMGGMDKYSK